MNGGAPLEVGPPRRPGPVGSVVESGSPPAAFAPAVQVDFAQVFGDYLLVYGWIFGLANSVARAELRHGETVLDLLSRGVRLPRPDVTSHLVSRGLTEDDDHGFCLMVAANEPGARHASLTLSVTLHSGATAETSWPVGHGSAPVVSFFNQHRTTLERLLAGLEPLLAEPLRDLVSPLLALPGVTSATAVPTLPFEHHIDLCCILENRLLLIVGWLIDPDKALEAAQVRIGATTWDFLAGLQGAARPDSGGAFTFLSTLREPAPAAAEITLTFHTRSARARLRHPVSAGPLSARQDLANLLSGLEPDAALELIERLALPPWAAPEELALAAFLSAQHSLAVMRLPVSLECTNPRFMLHLDRVVPIATDGIFLNGWFNAESGRLAGVTCHNGFSGTRISDDWTRHARPDVAIYLAKMGIAVAEDDHGFACYVPVKNTRAPYFIAVTSSDGAIRRLRVPAPSSAATALETARTVLTSFNTQHRNLRSLLDGHIGPAVRAAWASRDTTPRKLTVHRYGAQPTEPPLSIIVPLYGRFDLAEVQMALFANDAQLREQELLYFVDDPAIYDDFLVQCADLYGLYQVPFSVAFCGVNLGFAGANNCAARIARGRHLLLMNSDVFPCRPGWARQMLDLYAGLPDAGLLGFKLLFEDGSVQHAGMSFRQHPPWGDLWINSHPYKGQSAQGLSGVREVDAVTAACVLVEAALYRELGGLSEDYIVGDFEDSDLCLRMAAAGRRNRVALDIEMYHLERQSQDRIGDSQWRTNLTVYNCWQHHQRWATQLGKASR